ncbi:MAG: AbrB/MazE/SpoVT family DNA-binding domain-containing protein [Nitrososphaerota archaeon]|nr:AbrB/MazE/SpoVT family DNA-binding domain-containing protein [Nitrososphaerota archaeon]
MGEAVIDDRGRIVIPNEVREELNLRPEQRLKVVPKGRGLVLTPEIGAEEFIAELRGCVHGSRVSPEELKKIWGESHAHD